MNKMSETVIPNSTVIKQENIEIFNNEINVKQEPEFEICDGTPDVDNEFDDYDGETSKSSQDPLQSECFF